MIERKLGSFKIQYVNEDYLFTLPIEGGRLFTINIWGWEYEARDYDTQLTLFPDSTGEGAIELDGTLAVILSDMLVEIDDEAGN